MCMDMNTTILCGACYWSSVHVIVDLVVVGVGLACITVTVGELRVNKGACMLFMCDESMRTKR